MKPIFLHLGHFNINGERGRKRIELFNGLNILLFAHQQRNGREGEEIMAHYPRNGNRAYVYNEGGLLLPFPEPPFNVFRIASLWIATAKSLCFQRIISLSLRGNEFPFSCFTSPPRSG